jgi:hypothetical protein
MDATVSVSIEMPTTTMSTTMVVSGTFTEKLDLDMFNMYVEQATDVTMETPIHADISTVMKSLLIAKDKKIVNYAKVTNKTNGKTLMQKCTVMNVSQMPEPAQLSVMLQVLMVTMRKSISCGGNDGTYDTWKVDKSYNGPIPPIPGIPPTNISSVSGSVSAEVAMTKDSLMHMAKTEVSAKAVDKGGKSSSFDVDLDMEVSDAKSGGPSPADLDYSSWGKCEPVVPPVDVDHLFDAPEGGLPFQQTTSLQQHVLATIKAAMKSESAAVQPVVV